jgi:general secretion pathway protein G
MTEGRTDDIAEAPAKRRKRRKGYSLLEILIVLAIMALIATLVGPRLLSQLDRSKITAAKAQMRSLETALETFRLDMGRYPTTAEGLGALSTAPGGASGWMGPYLNGAAPMDPWGRPYAYEGPSDPAETPKLSSLGADGAPGGDGLNADVTIQSGG